MAQMPSPLAQDLEARKGKHSRHDAGTLTTVAFIERSTLLITFPSSKCWQAYVDFDEQLPSVPSVPIVLLGRVQVYFMHPSVRLPPAIMVSVSPVHLHSGPQEFHVHQDYVYEHMVRQYGSQQVDVRLEM